MGGRGASSGRKNNSQQNTTDSLPSSITGTREERAQKFEQIEREYPAPPGVMNEYHIEEFSGTAEIHFDNNYLRGEDISIRYPRGTRASEEEKAGAIKYEIYQHRPALELSALSRRGGFATFEQSQKWGGRLLSDKEKAQVNSEMEAHIRKLFNSPLSRKGRELNESQWTRESGGWRRKV